MQALIDSDNRINAMTTVFMAKLGLISQETSIRAQKMIGIILEIYSIASAGFLSRMALEEFDSLRKHS